MTRFSDEALHRHTYTQVEAQMVRELKGNAVAALVASRLQFRLEGGGATHTADGRVWWRASLSQIADETGLSPDQAKRAMKTLTEKGFVEARHFALEGPYDRTLSYSIAPPAPIAPKPEAFGGIATDPMAESPDVPFFETENKTYPPTPPSAEGDLFEQAWALWPRRADKKRARDKWNSAAKRKPPADILASVAAWRQAYDQGGWTKKDYQYVKHFATWLNGDCWDDELPEPRTTTTTTTRRSFAEDREARERAETEQRRADAILLDSIGATPAAVKEFTNAGGTSRLLAEVVRKGADPDAVLAALRRGVPCSECLAILAKRPVVVGLEALA